MLDAINSLTDADKVRTSVREGETKYVEFKETFSLDPHSDRNGRGETIKKQVQEENSSVGRREKRNLKYEDEEETN